MHLRRRGPHDVGDTLAAGGARLAGPGARLAWLGMVAWPAVGATQDLPRARPVTGTITGAVVDATTAQPVADADVRVGATARGARTDAAGRFTITALAPGVYVLRITRLGFRPAVQADVVVPGGRAASVAVGLSPAPAVLGAVRSTASEFAAPPGVSTTSFRFSSEEVRRSPGAIGDVGRLAQSLPGVVTANDQRNDIVARGGSPAENLVLVDNIEVPNLNHFAAQGTTGGPISMLNTEFVRDVTFLAGGFPAAYGTRLSSVLDIHLREGSRRWTLLQADASMSGAGVVAEGPLGRRRGGAADAEADGAEARGAWMVSARALFLSLLARPFGLTAVPHAQNWQFKADYDPGPRDHVWVVGLGGREHIAFNVRENDLDDPSLENSSDAGGRAVVGANWQHLLGARGAVVFAASDASGVFDVTVRDRQLANRLTFRNRSAEGEATLKFDLAYRLPVVGDARVGAAWKGYRTSLAVSAPLGMQSPWTPSPARLDTLALDLRSWASAGSVYAQLTRTLGRAVGLTGGLRADRFGALGRTVVSPRLGATVHLAATVDLSASFGRYAQQPPFAWLAAAPQNRLLLPMRADHRVIGLAWLAAPDLRVTLEAYEKRYADYPVSARFPQLSLANVGDQYGIAEIMMPMTSAGVGRARGVELYAQKRLSRHLYGQLSATVSRARHAALDGQLRRGAFDVPHATTGIVGYRMGSAWEFAGRATYAAGRPTTPALLDSARAQNRLVYDLSRVTAARAKDYARVDLRVDRRLLVGRSSITAYLELQNATNRTNVFFYTWNPKRRSLAAVPQVRRLPIAGVNVKF